MVKVKVAPAEEEGKEEKKKRPKSEGKRNKALAEANRPQSEGDGGIKSKKPSSSAVCPPSQGDGSSQSKKSSSSTTAGRPASQPSSAVRPPNQGDGGSKAKKASSYAVRPLSQGDGSSQNKRPSSRNSSSASLTDKLATKQKTRSRSSSFDGTLAPGKLKRSKSIEDNISESQKSAAVAVACKSTKGKPGKESKSSVESMSSEIFGISDELPTPTIVIERPGSAPTESKSKVDSDEPPHFPSGSAVLVAVRIRPPNEREKQIGSGDCIKFEASVPKNKSVYTQLAQPSEHKFSFDVVLSQKSTQPQAYNHAARLILPKVLFGYNGCVFAYGQTGSGKTYTMEGVPDAPGVITTLCGELFDTVGSRRAEIVYVVRATYVEIYNENVRDLLRIGVQSQASLKIREDTILGFYVDGATQLAVDSQKDLVGLIEQGTKLRTIGETGMNAVSSRSHAVLTLFVQQRIKKTKTMKYSKLHLVDLAGSERARDTGATDVLVLEYYFLWPFRSTNASLGDQLREGANINKSLSALGTVINALTDKSKGKGSFVPYRNSSLTRLLQDSLGGNSLIIMYCNASPAAVNHSESLSSLRFADRLKMLQNKVVINQKVNRLALLRNENADLHKKLTVALKELRQWKSAEKDDDHRTRGELVMELGSLAIELENTRQELFRAQIQQQKKCCTLL